MTTISSSPFQNYASLKKEVLVLVVSNLFSGD
jgi:hypothetical protein